MDPNITEAIRILSDCYQSAIDGGDWTSADKILDIISRLIDKVKL